MPLLVLHLVDIVLQLDPKVPTDRVTGTKPSSRWCSEENLSSLCYGSKRHCTCWKLVLPSAEGELATLPGRSFIVSICFNYNSISILINILIGDINGMNRQD